MVARRHEMDIEKLVRRDDPHVWITGYGTFAVEDLCNRVGESRAQRVSTVLHRLTILGRVEHQGRPLLGDVADANTPSLDLVALDKLVRHHRERLLVVFGVMNSRLVPQARLAEKDADLLGDFLYKCVVAGVFARTN